MRRRHPQGNVRYYGDDLAFQTVEELLEFNLVSRHADIDTMNFVFHFLISNLGAA